MRAATALLLAALVGLVVAPAMAFSDEISGICVARTQTAAFLLQLVETPDGRVVGRFEQLVLQPNGTTVDTNASITGAANGRSVVLSIRPTGLLPTVIPASGSVRGQVLRVAGGAAGQPFGISLVRGDVSDFNSYVGTIEQHGRQITARATEQQDIQREASDLGALLARIERLVRSQDDYVRRADIESTKLASTANRYHSVIQRMRAAMAREQAIQGGGPASLERGQIAGAIRQVNVAMLQPHSSALIAYSQYRSVTAKLEMAVGSATQDCQDANASIAASPGSDDSLSVGPRSS